MNLTSCEKCGVVVDRDRMGFPPDDYPDDMKTFAWDDNRKEAVVCMPCPVCQEPIKQY